jgi:hypothetical protein
LDQPQNSLILKQQQTYERESDTEKTVFDKSTYPPKNFFD